jgi:hypothetical protein
MVVEVATAATLDVVSFFSCPTTLHGLLSVGKEKE